MLQYQTSVGASSTTEDRSATRSAIEIIEPGLQTTIQDYPGRVGHASIGMFPAGALDDLSARVANHVVHNPPDAAVLEIPLGRFQARMLTHTQIAVCGAEGATLTLNDQPVPLWETIEVVSGDLLTIGVIQGPGFRHYLAVNGGIAVPPVYDSRSTYLIGGIGGLDGRALAKGDVLPSYNNTAPSRQQRRFPQSLRPTLTTTWEIELLRGPYADPDFLTAEDWHELITSTWRVDLNSSRVATRLNPHRFRWARQDGGIAGGHPSNVLDVSYPRGGILANGDTLTILGPDSNTSGGFAVIATVPSASLWKLGQLRPGRDTVTFREIGIEEANKLRQNHDFLVNPDRLDVQPEITPNRS